jgi:hypothetical protein
MQSPQDGHTRRIGIATGVNLPGDCRPTVLGPIEPTEEPRDAVGTPNLSRKRGQLASKRLYPHQGPVDLHLG